MKKEIIGILLFFLVILTFVSLFSYSPADPSINNHVLSSAKEIYNFFGLLGAFFAGTLIAAFGLGSFWLPVILLACSINYLQGRSQKIILLTFCGGIALIVSTGSFLSLFHTQYVLWGKTFSSGGIVGISLARVLFKYANTSGAIIVLICVFSMGFVLATGISLFAFALTIKNYILILLFFILKILKKEITALGKFFQFLWSRNDKILKVIDITPLSSKVKNLTTIIKKDGQGQEREQENQQTGQSDSIGHALKLKDSSSKIAEIENREIKITSAGNENSSCFFTPDTAGHKDISRFEDIREEKDFNLPPASLLKEKKKRKTDVDIEKLKEKGKILEEKLSDFNIAGEVVEILPGPVITTFEYRPSPGIKISKIVNLTDDLALALSAMSIRIIAPIPGKDVVGIEIPNDKREIVILRELIDSPAFAASPSKLTLCMGKNILGAPVVAQLEIMPHLLIAGATGTGKSVGLNAMIISLLYKAAPDEVKFIMIDPKRIELSVYDGIPHLISPVVTDMKKATNALLWGVREMERRYELLAENGVRNILQYNAFAEKQNKRKNKIYAQKTHIKQEEAENNDSYSMDNSGEPMEILPYIVVIVDEFADLMMVASRDVEAALIRLAQMARAAGIHLILATQRPSVDVLTGIIKANFPTRISFQVSSRIDSRTILDTNGSERLLGNGDMLFLPPGTGRLQRIQCAYISEAEISRITDFLKAQKPPEYVEDVTKQIDKDKKEIDKADYDEKYDEAVALITKTRQASISSVQRHLRIGYNRAARIIEMMETEGIIGPQEGSKPREILVKSYEN